jgi:hypothetical protein
MTGRDLPCVKIVALSSCSIVGADDELVVVVENEAVPGRVEVRTLATNFFG